MKNIAGESVQPNLLPPSEGRGDQLMSVDELRAKIDAFEDGLFDGPQLLTHAEKQKATAAFLQELLDHPEGFQNIFRTERGSTYFILQSGESFRVKRTRREDDQEEIKNQPVTRRIFFVEPDAWQKFDAIIKNGRQFYTRNYHESPLPEETEALQKRKQIYEELSGKKMDDQEFEVMIDFDRSGMNRLIGESILTSELKPGVIPIEMGFAGEKGETLFRREGKNIILLGHKTEGRDGKEFVWPESIGVYHIGHPVKEILK